MAKVFRGFRFDREQYDAFCRLTEKEGYTATAALERFIGDCVSADKLTYAGRRVLDFEAEARVLTDWLSKGKLFYRSENGEEINIAGQLLMLLPKVADAELKRRIEETLKNSVSTQGNV